MTCSTPGWFSCRCWTVLLLLLLPSLPRAFHVTMEYKPPVKSTVKQLYERRFRDSSFSSSSSSSSSSPSSSWNQNPKRTSKAAHASALSMPTPSNFELRMRDLVLGSRATTAIAAPVQQPRGQQQQLQQRPGHVLTIETLQDFKTIVGDESERLVVVRFYATYCKACKAVAPLFYRMAREYPLVQFVDVPVTDKNAALHQGLGIATLPFAHIYHPHRGLVEEHKLTRKDIVDFQGKLDNHISSLDLYD